MSQSGNTDWIYQDESNNTIFTDTYIDEDSSYDDTNYDTVTTMLLDSTSNNVQAIIQDITIPKKEELVDSNGNPLPADVKFSKIEMRLYLNSAPSGDTLVEGFLLSTKAVIPHVTWNTTNGSTSWDPDYAGLTHTDLMCTSPVIGTGSSGYVTFTFKNLSKNNIDFGSNFQLILYALSSNSFAFRSIDHGTPASYAPNLKIYFRKPKPDPAKISIHPDAYGLNGMINIDTHTQDKNLQKYYVGWDTDATVIQSDNTYTITDTNLETIAISDLPQEAKSGTPAYTKRWPLAFNEPLSFALFSEDNYNTTTNSTKSNIAGMAATGAVPIRPEITSFDSYNAAGASDAAPAIGEEMTLTITDTKDFTEFGILFDVEASLIDTGITWEDDVGGSTMTNTNSNAAYTKLYNSDPDGLLLGDMVKITSGAGTEFMKVVGHDSGFTVVERAQMNTAAVNHTGLADTTKIYKINYDDVVFTKLKTPTAIHSFKHRFTKASTDIHTNHVAAVIKNASGFASDLKSLNATTGITVAESNPIAKLTTSRTKVPYAKYGDKTAGVTLSLSNSRAVGSNRQINHYGFSYDAADTDTVATANALTNNNAVFDSGTKRVSLISTGAGSLTDSTWRIFGIASFEDDGTTVSPDNAADFSHYQYVSERITVTTRLTQATSSNYWKNIECVICEEIDPQDAGNRFLLMAATADLNTSSASVLNEGDGGVDLTVSETGVTVVSSSFYKPGDIVKIGSELCLVESIDSSTAITVRRKYFFTTPQEYNDGQTILLVDRQDKDNIYINNNLRAKADYSSANTATKYMWGGFAQIIADNIDFDSTYNLMYLDSVTSASSVNNEDWYDNGFAIGDIIKVKSNQTENGTYAAPGYYKIMDIKESTGPPDSGDFDYIYVAEHADMLTAEEALYVSTSLTDNDNKTADIVRYDNAGTPTITCAFYNYDASGNAYLGDSDTIKFEGMVIDDDTTSFLANTDSDTTFVRTVGLSTLDLDALASSGDIAITSYKIGRSGGASATMPLGNRRYPIGSTSSKLGSVSMSVELRILTQAGYRQVYSLIEGDRYDYVFLDSNNVDTPTSAYKSFRMKLSSGTISKSTAFASQYTASLNLLILGEEIV